MDPKIVQLMKKIIAEPDGISDIQRHNNEYYFRFKKRLFSILEGTTRTRKYGEYSFYLYLVPDTVKATAIIEMSEIGNLDQINMVATHAGEAASGEEKKVFSELYSLIKRKDTNLDQVLDDLLKD